MIAIIAAMELERDAFLSRMNHVHEEIVSGISMHIGTLHNHEVVLMLSGVGKGHAAMSTTILLEHYPITHVINIGTAGGVCEDEQILDIVIGSEVVQHDFDTSCIDGVEGLGKFYQADKKMIEAFQKGITLSEGQVFCGLIASGDQFVVSGEHMDTILNHFPKTLCCEMEAGAVAQVAHHYQCPFVVIRSLSDVACHSDSHMDFLQYARIASERSASFVEASLKYL